MRVLLDVHYNAREARYEALRMSAREQLNRVLEELPEGRLQEVLNFAESLNGQEESALKRFGQAQLARAYGDDEPEYSLADLRPEPAS